MMRIIDQGRANGMKELGPTAPTAYCPECGHDKWAQTYCGYMGKNLNKAWCSCGWVGQVCDLIEKVSRPK